MEPRPKACIDNRKNLLNSNISSARLHNMANFDPITAEIGSGVWDTPANFMGFAFCLRTAATSLTGGHPNFARCLAVSWAGTLCIHSRGLLPPDGILPGAKFTLRSIKSCVRLYWQSYCTALQQRASAKLCGVVQGMGSRKFRRGHHLYSAGRLSRWASAYIVVS